MCYYQIYLRLFSIRYLQSKAEHEEGLSAISKTLIERKEERNDGVYNVLIEIICP
jgi:hypothetical protein